eukprot:GHVS01026771.1.p2 GENE.GHVS01026771.1~~GHVS01026771.1.p2  ORF type:complete len:119 (-),score=15.49 GHVS01026771.1:65-421(-)
MTIPGHEHVHLKHEKGEDSRGEKSDGRPLLRAGAKMQDFARQRTLTLELLRRGSESFRHRRSRRTSANKLGALSGTKEEVKTEETGSRFQQRRKVQMFVCDRRSSSHTAVHRKRKKLI